MREPVFQLADEGAELPAEHPHRVVLLLVLCVLLQALGRTVLVVLRGLGMAACLWLTEVPAKGCKGRGPGAQQASPGPA